MFPFRFFFLLLTINVFCPLFGQHRKDYQWIIGGYSSGNGIKMNFNEIPVKITFEYTGMGMEGSNTSMADNEGNFLFASNGCMIINSLGEVMENGDSINPGIIGDSYYKDGSPLIQGVIAVPSPENENVYYVFNLDLDFPYLNKPEFLGVAPLKLYYQKIDMSQNAGLGSVIAKNQIAIADTFARGNIQAVKHSNGKDWWVIVPESHSNCYYLLPITQNGIMPPQRKCSGVTWSDEDLGAQCVFSPDGKKYIRFNGFNGLNIFDFDTSNGELSNPISILFPNDTINYLAGVSVSSNSRYLYVSARKKLYQFDLRAENVEESRVLIGIWDGYENPYPTIFYVSALAPDKKIYISNSSSTLNLHVINKPDCPGSSCELIQHGIVLPAHNFATIPNNPHYRNESAICDSVLSQEGKLNIYSSGLNVYPNPSTSTIYFPKFEELIGLKIINSTGQEISAYSVSEYPDLYAIDIQTLYPGIFYLLVEIKGYKRAFMFVKL